MTLDFIDTNTVTVNTDTPRQTDQRHYCKKQNCILASSAANCALHDPRVASSPSSSSSIHHLFLQPPFGPAAAMPRAMKATCPGLFELGKSVYGIACTCLLVMSISGCSSGEKTGHKSSGMGKFLLSPRVVLGSGVSNRSSG